MNNNEQQIRAEAARILGDVPLDDLAALVRKHGDSSLHLAAEVERIRAVAEDYVKAAYNDVLQDEVAYLYGGGDDDEDDLAVYREIAKGNDRLAEEARNHLELNGYPVSLQPDQLGGVM